ncbi:hypothetical protein ACF1AY_15940 [Streptomyces sp. NPDC014776]|uniref:hypothetical protein n=1 Tax=unclassified Streptomyces TaxID=2593676 RepID=UPI0036F7AC1C
MHRAASAFATVLLITSAATACSSSDKSDSKPTTQPSTAASTPAAPSQPKKLADVYTAKLDAVSEGSIEKCQSPSSTACANDIGAIMTVVGDLERDIDANGGASEYPKATKQIATMKAAQQDYKNNGCEGDPTADDPNSDCWGVANITLGATTLSMTLSTDELS